MIRFEHVTKAYGQIRALHDVSVDIQDGEFVFLIGPSGAGKTTFLRLLIRDIAPSRGTICIDSWNLGTLPRSSVYLLRRKVGTVFQDFKLLSDRTVFENVALGLEIRGKNDSEIERDVMRVLTLVKLGEKRHLFPQQMSAGELQRTSIARTIVGGPSVILADEPTGNLDPDTAWEILEILQQVNSLGTTVIMATHNAGIVNDLKKRTIALDRGSMVSDEAKGRYHTTHKTAAARHKSEA
ncbi:cell division ATP-binding protein FtsE [Candidatus Gottesmanbacteria bacterium RIFCSPLOWO2_01_FULL_49_10]|uniref:Cell division ATP-binding protein FtsE n=1 Tax=Candidatus Gottesmanbacteria bacterium RIFCSPLOWO2_01_FULL_49_10 TaxID=1798396 RepID=A0A1F6AZ98_9BACT|nr:MAG: cell division ATP-binding protein FtsE [Candidatus Gottesmanbacteria bacterium RIFCSPLOWO2_01_FULL_49_10]